MKTFEYPCGHEHPLPKSSAPEKCPWCFPVKPAADSELPNREVGCPSCGQLGKPLNFASAPDERGCENPLCRVIRFNGNYLAGGKGIL